MKRTGILLTALVLMICCLSFAFGESENTAGGSSAEWMLFANRTEP